MSNPAPAHHPLYLAALLLVALLSAGYLMVVAQGLLIPLVVALFLWYVVKVLAALVGNVRIGGRALPRWLRYTAAIAVLVLAVNLVIEIISSSVGALIEAAPGYQQAFERLAFELQGHLGFMDLPELSAWVGDISVAAYIRTLAAAFSGFIGNLGLIALFLLFIVIEQRYFSIKVNALIAEPRARQRLYQVLDDIDRDVRTYIGIKTAVSLLTAISSYLVMYLVGLDYAGFWALLIFLLNFIPNIGSIIATIFPSLLALVQFDSLMPFLIVALGISTIQFVVGQILEPLFAGRTLNVSPLAIIVSLVIWSMMWGVAGAFLCVPILMISMIILSHFESTRWVAVLLSQNGTLTRPVDAFFSGEAKPGRSGRYEMEE